MGKLKGGRAVIYARISDDRDGEGAGVARQIEECRALAARHGLTVVAELVDNSISASSYSRKPRPSWRELLRLLERREVDSVVAWASDRLYRQMPDLEMLIRLLDGQQIEVVTVNGGVIDLSTSDGRLNARIVASVAAHESERKSERVRSRLLQKAQNGEPSGGGARCYGYSPDGLSIVPEEAAVIRDALDRVLAGDTLTAIANRLNTAGTVTSTGGRWRIGTLRRVLTAWRIAGVREHLGETYPAKWPGIVDEPTLERVRAVLLDPERKKTRPNPRVSSLRGLAFCGLDGCGQKLITASHGDAGHAKRTYRCGRPPQNLGCGNLSVRAEALEAEVYGRVGAVLAGPGLTAAIRRVAGGVAGSESASAQLVAARQKMRELSDEYWQRDGISKGEYERHRQALEDQIGKLESEVAAPASTRDLAALPQDAAGIEVALREMDPATAHALLRLLITRIVVSKGRPGRFDPERVRIEWAV